ncbi:MAG: radical SAM family heme chaperone HemW [Terriglobales bacterium]
MLAPQMIESAYIHIPFCTHKCDFCDFAAFAGVDHLEEEYCRIVCREIDSRLADRAGDAPPLLSVFFGGGTPGLAHPDNVERIQRALTQRTGLAPAAEISLETTPHAITREKGKRWREIGINRLSIGIESLQDDELKAIGRDHTRAQALRGIELACDAGFENISCDFMYSLPTQTLSTWQKTLNDFVALSKSYESIKHVSAYGLHLASNSPLYSRFPRDCPQYPDDDLFAAMYETLVDTLEGVGFNQYEVSNFARAGFQSFHNTTYWRNAEYYAFGVSAHRYVGGVRSSNWRSLKRYMRDYLGDETHEPIDHDTAVREGIMLGLRVRAGIDLEEFERHYGIDLSRSKSLKKLVEGGFLELESGRLRITRKGVPVSNSVIAELI